MANLIEKFPVPLIFKKILGDKLTGELEVTGKGFAKKLYLKDGDILYAESDKVEDRLGEVMFANGKISREQLVMLRKMRDSGRDKLGKILVQHRVLSRHGLFAALQDQVKAIAVSCFFLASGQWVFKEKKPDLPGSQRFTVNMGKVIAEGCKSVYDFTYFRERFNFRAPVVLPIPEDIGQLLSSEEIKFYVKLTKCHSMASVQIVSILNITDHLFWQQMILLYLMGVIDFTEFRVDPDLNERIELINDLHEKLTSHSIDHYELLELKDTASVSEVQDKYFSFTKHYSPESIQAPPDSKTMEKTDFVFTKVSQAYDTLSHEEKKKAYDTGQFKMVEVPEKEADEQAEKARKARDLYLKANSHYEQKQFVEAVRLMDEAVKLDTSRSNYFMLLGLSQTRIPSLRPDAEKNLKKVADMEPWNADPLFYLGQLYWAENLVNKAEGCFRKALEINMEHTLAAKMMRKIESRVRKKQKPLFSMFGKKE
jgi:tetratricopeptide (TPR) repeat protein